MTGRTQTLLTQQKVSTQPSDGFHNTTLQNMTNDLVAFANMTTQQPSLEGKKDHIMKGELPYLDLLV